LFDVAIVAAVLAAQGVFRAEELRGTVLLGELGLDGRLRPIRGILPATLAAQQAGFTRVIVPLRQAGEAKLVEGIEVFGIASITLGNALVDLIRPMGVIGVGKLWHAATASALRLAATRSAGYWPWPERSSAGALPKQRTTMTSLGIDSLTTLPGHFS
jgi:hypothetical protein